MKWMLRRVTAAVLSACMAVAVGPGVITARAENLDMQDRVITGIKQLPESVTKQVVETGKEESDLKLPKTLEVTYTVEGSEEDHSGYENGGYGYATPGQADEIPANLVIASPVIASPAQIKPGGGYSAKINVVWECFPDYDSSEAGEYLFTPVLPELYTVGDGIFLPEIEITVTEKSSGAVKALMKKIDALPSVDSIYDTMPGDATPEFDEWLAGMREVMQDVREAKKAYDELTEEEREQLPAAHTEKLMDLVNLMERLEEMSKLGRDGDWKDNAAGSFAGGDGTESEPYQISTPEELAYLAKLRPTDTKNKYYELTADIDLGSHDWNPSERAFYGNFNGNNKTISNMWCKESTGYGSGGGLFGEIGDSGASSNLKIQNIVFEHCTVQDNPEAPKIAKGAGILAGYVNGRVDILNCHVRNSKVEISGNIANVGGLAGFVGFGSKSSVGAAGQVIENCSVESTVVQNKNGGIGGMIGQAFYGIKHIKNCTVEATQVATEGVVDNGARAGGLLGYLACGFIESEISDCKVIGEDSSVTAGDEAYGFCIGGLIGEIYFEERKKSIKLAGCTSEAEVSSAAVQNGCVGGLLGIAKSSRSYGNVIYFSVEDCHASGNVSGKSKEIGGLVGSMMGNLKNCSASGDVTGYVYVGGLVGKQDGDGDSPQAEITGCCATGSVTTEQGEKASVSSSAGGLIGCATAVLIQDSYAAGDVNGDGYNYGGLVGESSHSSLQRCYALGTVTASNWQVGGLTGYTNADKIENCYAMGEVHSEVSDFEPRAGGLIGNGCGSTIKNCYSSGKVTAVDAVDDETVAGFIGCNVADYGNSGITVVNCSYDKETSGQSKGIGTAGETSSISLKAEKTSDMIHPNQAYYLNEDGQNSVWGWKKGENSNYPYLGNPKITSKQNSEAYLTALSVSGQAQNPEPLTPAFDKDTLDYQLQTAESSIEIQAAAAVGASMKIRRGSREQVFTGASVESLSAGENIIYIEVTSEDGLADLSYKLTVVRKETGVLTGALKGIVRLDGTPVSGAKVEVRIGGTNGTLVADTLTDSNGSYVLANLKHDIYSVVVSQEAMGRKITRIVEIAADETLLDLDLPDGKKSTVVEQEGAGTPPIAAEGLEAMFEDRCIASGDEGGYTEEDKTIVEHGGLAELKLNGEMKQGSELGAELDRLQDKAGGESPVLIMDFTVIKTIKDSAGTQLKRVLLTELPSLIHIVVPVPEQLKEGGIKVIRLHNGRAEEIPEGSGSEYFTLKGDNIHLYVNKFSFYAFTGTGKPVNPVRDSGSRDSSRDIAAGIWKRDEKGWYYLFSNDLWASKGWYYLYWNEKYYWYHFDDRGYLDTGWLIDKDGNRYYLHPYSDGEQGYMYTGWRQIDGNWHYFEPLAGHIQGRLYTNTVTPDGYTVDENGIWVK